MMDTTVAIIQAQLELDSRLQHGEGAIWNPLENRLYWIDVEKSNLHIYDPAIKKDAVFNVGSFIGTVVPFRQNTALVALQNGIHSINIETAELTFLINPLTDKNIRFNDGKCDPSGRFWVGTMHLDAVKNAAVLYRMDANKSIKKMLHNVTVSNGIVWTSDKKTMYYIDTEKASVQAFDFNNANGEITNGSTVLQFSPDNGMPDGMTIDENDNLWIAMWNGGAVLQCNPRTAEIMQKIEVPAINVSSCAFGGEQLDTLFITTAREGLTTEQLSAFPLSGGLFVARPGVKGVVANFYQPAE